jgi:DNA-binding transcriptional regulator of glucitol operon
VLAPKWWLLHVAVLAIAVGMLRLGLWQWHRADTGNGGMQNYAYAFQWPLFAAFGIVLWIRTLVEESRRDDSTSTASTLGRSQVTPDAPIIRQPGVRVGLTTTRNVEDDDPEVAARNAALAAMNAATEAAQNRAAQSRRG